MVGETYVGYARNDSNLVVKEEKIDNYSLIKESQEASEETTSFVDRDFVDDDLIERKKQETNSNPCIIEDKINDAPTKPLPPEPQDMAIDSEEDENKIAQNTSSEDSDVENVEEDRNKSPNGAKDIEADLLEPLDEYDKHPIPESVEFLHANKDYHEDAVLYNNDTSTNAEEPHEDINDDNTSPSQDSSFQMLDMGSDSDAGKGFHDEILSESKDGVSLVELEDTMVPPHDSDDPIATDKNDIIEQSVQSLVQFTDNSNIDSHVQSVEPLIEISSAPNNDEIRQTSKEFVDDLMEEALNITSEHRLENECPNQLEEAFDDADEKEKDSDHENLSHKSSPSTSPRELMDELLVSVPPPSSSPPQVTSDSENVIEAAKEGEEDEFKIEGDIKIEDSAMEDNNELERLLSDAQKDESEIHGDTDVAVVEAMANVDIKINETVINDMAPSPVTEINVVKDETEAKEIEITAEEARDVEITGSHITEGDPIVGIFGGSKGRKDSSSDYDENDGKEENEVDIKRDEEENPKMNRTISSDYEEENQDDEKSIGDDDDIDEKVEKKRISRSSSSEYEEENDAVGKLVTNEPSTKHRLKKRDSSSDYDDGNDNDAAEDRESSDSEVEQEVDIKTKTLADMDEGDPWSEKDKEQENEKISCSEYSEDNNPQEVLQHFDSDDLPAQDDMSHRAVFGDDDDRNDDDVLLLEENEDEAREREIENRKLSTTVPSLMEENESMTIKEGSLDDEVEKEQNIILKADEEEKKVTPVPSSELISDISLETGVESAKDAKESLNISEEVIGGKNLLLESDAPTTVTETFPEASLNVKGENFSSSISEAKEEPLIDF